MAVVIKGDKSVFTESIDGVFGIFKTNDSFDLNYLLSSLDIDRTQRILLSANEALKFDRIDFEEMVQRDIDFERVDKEIVQDYLEQGKDRVMFFPPLLVTLMAIDDSGKPITQFNKVDPTIIENTSDGIDEYAVTWDDNKFQLSLPLSKQATDSYVIYKKEKRYYYKHAATIKYNPNIIKLVVIDGQHRFHALKRIIEQDKRDLLNGMTVPICIFFSPDAVKASKEDMVRDMRELFVTINQTSKNVSGHFIVLLRDRSLSSHCIRDLANSWKKSHTLTPLHMLEWNQRSDRAAYQLTRKYSITTVSIIADTLKDYIFDKRTGGLCDTILNLSKIQDKLKVDEDSVSFDQIDETSFSLGQVKILKDQIKTYVTPSLTTLFTKPKPYQKAINKFNDALKRLDKDIAEGVKGAKQFKEQILFLFRQTTKSDQPPVKDYEIFFNEQFTNHDEDDQNFYFKNIFQQALIRSWAILCKELSKQYNLTPPQIAELLIDALELICFNEKKKMFDKVREYNNLLIYTPAQRIILTDSAKESTMNMLLATFLNETVRKKFISELSDKEEISEILYTIAYNNYCDMFDTYSKNINSHVKKNWRLMGLDESIRTYLHQRESSKDDKEIAEFKAQIEKCSEDITKNANKIFCNVLSIKEADIKCS